MIIWISSYPKSGNTYLRSFLSSYYFSKDGEFDFNLLLNINQFPALRYSDVKSYTYVEAAKNWSINQKKFFTKEKLFFLKTHNSLEEYFGYRFTKSSETLGAIYIVRDPRNVISSMCNHYSMNFNEMYNKMIDENASLSSKNSDGDLSNFSFLGSWSNHYKSWKNNFEFKTLFIKYEDLEKNAYDEFWKILIFIEELTSSGLYDKVSQAFAVFLPVKSVGVVGDARRHSYVIALRAVETVDFMTARWAHLDPNLLETVSNRIMNEISKVSRVVYDISGKPPSTIEWE